MKIIFASAVGLFALTAAAGFVLVASHSQEKRTSLQALVVPGAVADMSAPPTIRSVPEVKPAQQIDGEGDEVANDDTDPTSMLGGFESVSRPVERPVFVEEDKEPEFTRRAPAVRPAAPARTRPTAAPPRTVARQPAAISIERANLASGVFR